MGRKRRFTDEDRAELARLWPLDIPDKEIAFRLNRHRAVLHKEARRMGLTPRRALRRAKKNHLQRHSFPRDGAPA